jgi:putative flippase GtrA
MQRISALARHPLAGPTLRYVVAGSTVAAVYLAIPLVLNGVAGLPIQVAIPIAYVLAVSLHFTLQRTFVFRHVDAFALTPRQQIARYVAIGSVQYPTTALATALLPGALGVSERVVFVCTTVVISLTFFLILRGHVFHPVLEPDDPESGGQREVADGELLRDPSRPGQTEHDPVEA